jgi:hypothetical protein
MKIIKPYYEIIEEEYFSKPSEFHEKRISIKFSCDMFILEKLIKFSKEYGMVFNVLPIPIPLYPNKPFEYVIPTWMDIEEGNYHCSNKWAEIEFDYLTSSLPPENREYWGFKKDHSFDEYSDQSENEKEVQIAEFLHSIYNSEDSYCGMIDAGCTHEHATIVLPNSLKREIILSGFKYNWEKILKSVNLELFKNLKKEI